LIVPLKEKEAPLALPFASFLGINKKDEEEN
jgi:hypothetical protein